MGMYDEIQCDAPLPDGNKATRERFQTKSFPNPGMQRFRITGTGKLIDALGNDLEPDGYITLLSGRLSEIVRVSKDSDDQIRYGLASYRWFNTPSFLFCDDREDPGVEDKAQENRGNDASGG
jgi:hypothetical protein